MADHISIKIRGEEEVKKMLADLPYGTKRIAVQAVTEYLLGDDRHGLRHYPPVTTQKYVRTFQLKQGWSTHGDEYKPIIVNYTPYAPYVPRWKKYGWREWKQVIVDNMKGAMIHAQSLVNRYIDKWR